MLDYPSRAFWLGWGSLLHLAEKESEGKVCLRLEGKESKGKKMEYEYEVTFRGSQWTANILCYHELDSEITENRSTIEDWAEAVANNNGLELNDYHEIVIVKTGELK